MDFARLLEALDTMEESLDAVITSSSLPEEDERENKVNKALPTTPMTI